MANLSFVLHCVDGAVIATDMWTWPGSEGPPDVLPVGDSGCVLVHGPNLGDGLELWKSSNLSSLSTIQPSKTFMGRIVEVVAPFALERSSKGVEVPRFGYLVAGYFPDHGDLVKLNLVTVNPSEVEDFSHNVFVGANDVARALDQKLPPRSLTVGQALFVAAFWILQSHSVYSRFIGTRFALATLDRRTGLKWIGERSLRQIQKAVARAGLKWSRASLSLFHDDVGPVGKGA